MAEPCALALAAPQCLASLQCWGAGGAHMLLVD